jgi:hypothetical protein
MAAPGADLGLPAAGGARLGLHSGGAFGRRWGKADLQQARRKLAALEKGSPAPPQIFSEAEVNACLAADLNARLKVGTFKLQAIHVQLKPNAVVISALANCEPTLPGGLKPGSLDFSYRVTGVPQMGADGFSFEIARGMIGHLPLPGSLARAILPQLQAHFKELGRNYPAINAIKRLELADGQITVSSGK